jgi:hypothetical protein
MVMVNRLIKYNLGKTQFLYLFNYGIMRISN